MTIRNGNSAMISHLVGFVLLSIFFIDLAQTGENDWLIFLDERRNAECFANGGRYFCHSNEEKGQLDTNVSRNACMAVNGTPLSFVELTNSNITTETLMEWIIPFHLIEQYADYLNSSRQTSMDETLICNCSLKRFGTHCDYEIENKTLDLTKVIKAQRGGKSGGEFETLTSLIDEMPCNASFPPVEWRQICDGIIQCENAVDELHCDRLELNECGQDEYRCRNGMCIPKESSFDGVFDCMDSSDEQELPSVFRVFDTCDDQSRYECDERLCRKDQFSCGDGQCVPWSALINGEKGCRNSRHQAYRCDTVDIFLSEQKNLTGICQETNESFKPLTKTSSCAVSLRHLLTSTRPEIRNMSMENLLRNCPEWIKYPEEAVLSPGLAMYYNRSQLETLYDNGSHSFQSTSRRPHLYCLHGKAICDGASFVNHANYCITDDEFQRLTSKYPFLPFSHLFCEIVANQNFGSQFLKDPRLYRCNNTAEPISPHRVNDGYVDCLYRDDERNSKPHPSHVPNRYRCETVPKPYQYVSYQQLGNGIEECRDGSDEMSSSVRWSLLKCDYQDAYACWLFQNIGRNISSVVLPYYRHCDTVWDTVNGSDESDCEEWICSPGELKCLETGQCIQKNYRCDGEFDCFKGEDELNCPNKTRQWKKEGECNSTKEFFCITPIYLTNVTAHRPCIAAKEVGDGRIDCVGARDERNVFACPDRQMLGDRFVCDNQSKCLNYTILCDGKNDCIDQTDERICFWNRTRCPKSEFTCADGTRCYSTRCDSKASCIDRSHWFWCPNPMRTLSVSYRANKDQPDVSSNQRFCYKQSSIPRISAVVRQSQTSTSSVQSGYCNRGFYLTGRNRSDLRCFCPPSYYGPRCQYDSRRVTVIVLFDRWHRRDIPVMINVLVTLIHNDSQVVDHHILTDFARDYFDKHHLYLLYPRPRLPGNYSVRFEAYHSLQLLALWEYPISPFDFLPVFRLAKALLFPTSLFPDQCTENLCENNGTCYRTSTRLPVCLCPREWHGSFCEKESFSLKCAAHSLVRAEQICICPQGYHFPGCFVPNRKCEQNNTCPATVTCFSVSGQPPNRFRCFCNRVECSEYNTTVSIYRDRSSPFPIIFQLLNMSSDYPVIQQQILIYPSTNFPVHELIKVRNPSSGKKSIPEIGLAFMFEPLKRSVMIVLHSLYTNCSQTIKHLIVDLNSPLPRCLSLKDSELSTVKALLPACQQLGNPSCFQWKNYICYCNISMFPQGTCISYHQRQMSCDRCFNQGFCVQGDLLNVTDYTCVCPKCASGALCEFSSDQYSISLEYLYEKTGWGLYHFLFPSVFLLLVVALNGLCFVTFLLPRARRTGTGVYLLISCVINQLIFGSLFCRILYLYMVDRIVLRESLNQILCQTLPYLMYSLYLTSLWLMSLVTVERAVAATLPSYYHFWGKPRFAGFLSFFALALVAASTYPQLDQYKVVSSGRSGSRLCTRQMESSEQFYVHYLPLLHQISPFVVNLVAALAIIMAISRSKATIYNLSARQALRQQTDQRKDLLLGPIMCFITQLPQLIMIFLDVCDYQSNGWFVHLILITHYLSFTPQLTLFFLYLLPSPLYKQLLVRETLLAKRFLSVVSPPVQTSTKPNVFSLRSAAYK